MKRLSVVLLLQGLAGCNYPSMTEAGLACYKWMNEAKKVNYEREMLTFEKSKAFEEIEMEPIHRSVLSQEHQGWYKRRTDYLNSKKIIQVSICYRSCNVEKETRQFLGSENQAIKNGTWDLRKNPGNPTIVKRFRW